MPPSIFANDPISVETRDRIQSLASEFEALKSADAERLTRYKTHREELESSRSASTVSSSATSDYGRLIKRGEEPERHNIRLPFGMALTVKHSYRISGRLPDATVDRREETPQERYRSDAMEKMWWSILHESNGETLFSTGGWDGSLLGSSCFEPYFDIKKQMAVIRTVDPSGVIVVRGLDDPHKFQRVYRFWHAPLETVKAEYRDQTFDDLPCQINDLESTHKVGNVPMATLVEVKDKVTTTRFALGANTNGTKGKSTPLLESRHDLGFVPFVIVPNIGPERDIWGWADYEFYRDLTGYIPALFSREADIIRMVANGAVIEKGTGQDAKTVKDVLFKGGVLPSRKDGEVTPIQAPDIPSFEESHSNRAMEMMKMLGFAPDAAWGGSNTTSGADRSLQMQPQIEFTAMKQTNWTAGLKRLASMCFQMIEDKQVASATFRGSIPGSTPGADKAFVPFKMGPQEQPQQAQTAGGDLIEFPRSPRELFQGDYSIRFFWQNRVDPDDPAYVLSELNKFQQGVQSARTTLERLGVQSPEDELVLIEDEAARIPWLRSGMISLISAQLTAQAKGDQGGGVGGTPDTGTGQGQGGGGVTDGGLASLQTGLGITQGKDAASGAMGADAAAAGLGTQGQLYGGA